MKDKCRACKNETSQHGFLFKCIDRNCGAVFWHRKILLENLEDDAVFEKQLSLAEIPSVNNDDYFVYVIQLSRKKDEVQGSIYVGMTSLHPHHRYLNHISSRKGSRHVTKRGKVMIQYEGPMSRNEAIKREPELAEELSENYIVYGGH